MAAYQVMCFLLLGGLENKMCNYSHFISSHGSRQPVGKGTRDKTDGRNRHHVAIHFVDCSCYVLMRDRKHNTGRTKSVKHYVL